MKSSLTTTGCLLASTGFLVSFVSAHCKIVNVAASLKQLSGPVSHGFGVDLHNKYPWLLSQGGDAGGDSPVFSSKVEYVQRPAHPCGHTLGSGPVDIASSMAQAEELGVATTAADGSFETLIFQVNRDGGGPCLCEYDTIGSAQSWQKCSTLIHPPGVDGNFPADRVNHTAKFQIPRTSICRGGTFKDKCIVRLRCGAEQRFGGCFAIKTPSTPPPARVKLADEESLRMSPIVGLGQSDLKNIAQEIFSTMSAKGALVPQTSSRRAQRDFSQHLLSKRLPIVPSIPNSLLMLQGDAISHLVVEMIRLHHMVVTIQKATLVIKQFSQQ